jgi:hypothetical protein
MDPSKDGDKKSEQEAKDGDGGNQIDDESKEELAKKGAVGRRFAVVDIPKEAIEGAPAEAK